MGPSPTLHDSRVSNDPLLQMENYDLLIARGQDGAGSLLIVHLL